MKRLIQVALLLGFFCFGGIRVDAASLDIANVTKSSNSDDSAVAEVKGAVESIDRFAETFQVKTSSGELLTFTANPNLLIRVNGAPVTYSSMQVGDAVSVKDVTPNGGQVP